VQAREAIAQLERLAFRAWPAERVVDVDGWQLRLTHGMTRRANSVWPVGARGQLAVEQRVDTLERLYRSEGLPARVQITAVAEPADLDAQLAARGYEVETPVAIQVAPVASLAAQGAPPGLALEVLERPDARWLAISADRGRFAAMRPRYEALLGRIGERARFALASRDGEPVAVGLGVVEGGWLGVFSMLTLPESRRAGCGRAILMALARSGAAAGAERAYLQVERDNAAALALYAGLGFRELYGYHYRRL